MSGTANVRERVSIRQQFSYFIQMTRPGVLGLVLFTALPVLALSQEGLPELKKSLMVLFGAALCGASCSVLNAYVERETDAKMARTRKRPIPGASVVPEQALILGVLLAIVSTLFLWGIGGLIAGAVGLGTIVFYVVVYTIYLKPRTVQNIVIGGAAGATTPLIADAALNGELGMGSFLLFLIVFFWTPPHVWAIALYRKSEYEQAGIPMMPSKVGDQPTRWRMLGYTVLLTGVSLTPVMIGYMTEAYGVVAALMGAWLIWRNIGVIRAADNVTDRSFFMDTNYYLLGLFGMMVLDAFLM